MKNNSALVSYYEQVRKVYLRKLHSCFEVDFYPLFQLISNTMGTIWLIGNGGSLLVAQHAALDLTKAARKRAFAITDPGVITAYSNDISFNEGIASHLSQLWKKDDLLIALSTSGESENLLSAIKMAKRDGLFTVGLTSKDSSLSKIVKLPVEFEEKDPKILEDMFQIVFHQITKMLENVK